MPAVSERDRRIRKLAGTVPGYFFLSAIFPVGITSYFVIDAFLWFLERQGKYHHEIPNEGFDWVVIPICAALAGVASGRWIRNPLAAFCATLAFVDIEQAVLSHLFAGAEGRSRGMSAYLSEGLLQSAECGVAAVVGWFLMNRWLAWQDRRRQYWAGRR